MSSQNKDSLKEKHPSFWGPMLLMVAIGIAVSVWWYCMMTGFKFETNPEKAGVVGDSFGPLTSLFTSLALGASVVATFYQVKEFRSQLKEMQTSAEEMKKQTELYEQQLNEVRSQSKTLQQQRKDEILQHALEQLPFFVITYGPFDLVNQSGRAKIINTQSPVFSVEIRSPGYQIGNLMHQHFAGVPLSTRIHDCLCLETLPLPAPVQTSAGAGMPIMLHTQATDEFSFVQPIKDGHKNCTATAAEPIEVHLSYVLKNGLCLSEQITIYGFGRYCSLRKHQSGELRHLVDQEHYFLP